MLQPAKLKAVGYGFTEKDVIGQRNSAEIPILSPDCRSGRIPGCTPFAEMVLADTSRKVNRSDTCRGDSGGPVFLVEKSGYTLIGVTSRQLNNDFDNPLGHCGGGGIYVVLGRNSVHDWLEANGVTKAVMVPTKTKPGAAVSSVNIPPEINAYFEKKFQDLIHPPAK